MWLTLCQQDVVQPPAWNVPAPVVGPSVRMSRFEHVDGCKVCEGLYGHYTYPNGKTVHFYHNDTLHELLVDTSIQLPDPPTTLESIFQTDFPTAAVLGAPVGKPYPLGDVPPLEPSHFSDAPRPDTHTLPVTEHQCSGRECAMLGVLPDDDLISVRVRAGASAHCQLTTLMATSLT